LALGVNFLASVQALFGAYVRDAIAIDGYLPGVTRLTGAVVDHSVVDHEIVDRALHCSE